MKVLSSFIFGLIVFSLFSCNKNQSTTTSNSTMTASINGSNVTFSASFSYSNGYTILNGTSNIYTLQIYIQNIGLGMYYLGSSSTPPYANVSSVSGSYTTSSASGPYGSGQLNITGNGSAGLYNGNFSFSAIGSAGTITVSNGQFTNM